MANTRLFRSAENYALASGSGGPATIKNGTGGGAPALQEDSAYPMSNALHHDRFTPWKTPSTPPASPIEFDLTWGVDAAIYAMGVHRYRLHYGTAGTLTIKYQSGAYSAGGSWTSFGTVSGTNLTATKDSVVVDTATKTAQSARFSFAHTTAIFSVGKLWVVIAPTINPGLIYAVGGVETPVRYVSEVVGPSGIPVIADHGEDGRLWEIDFDAVTGSVKTTLWAAVNNGRPLSMLDENDALHEVRVQGGSLPSVRNFTDNWTVRVPLVKLP